MKSYMEAYSERIKANDVALRLLAMELKSIGCRVQAAKGEVIKFIKITKGGKQCTFGFEEVPYRWTVHVDVDYRKGKGSSICVGTKFGTKNEWLPLEIIGLMCPEVPQIGMGNYLTDL